MASRSCGTCRDRRILCDRTVPRCSQCAQSNRTCKGYGLRLSWPKANDKRRAVVARSFIQQRRAGPHSFNARLINISTWDIEMHRYLLGLVSSVQSTASCSLTTFGHDPTNVGNMLIRMALVNNAPSTVAVLRSLLALSSLHRSGLQSQAAELKIAALKALGVASNREIGTMETIQHVAAGMLLCSYEIHQASCTSGQWRLYIIGVKSVIKASSFDTFKSDSDFNALLDWVYYHDVLSRFSITHWHPPAIDRPLVHLDEPVDIPSPPVNTDPCIEVGIVFSRSTEITHSTQSSFTKILKSLTGVFNLVATKPSHMSSSEEADNFKSYLKILTWRIRSIPISDTIINENPSMATLVELFQLATLIYLNRVFGNILELITETQQQIERAFSIFSQLKSCERQYPLFILGCEARTDGERCIVLDLISRTEKRDSSRSLFLTKKLIQAIWVQDDLSHGEIDYTEKLSAILSCCTILPTFV
ncbi:hypothetical protein N7517_011050 [Penicillium concentricum]|uniref:Zn(2)-C6 fungal-type domain-containing protein n=1 Tax=Penicillium concentricum TaxID=293559 RepID=A0A9W9UVN0_9EURO|nr:uncharacterized protein N7517_011050 [Penicillium concentricum]KAJ5356441.1 hypothetical protein N7517_011050 [Penicillium concentricum]